MLYVDLLRQLISANVHFNDFNQFNWNSSTQIFSKLDKNFMTFSSYDIRMVKIFKFHVSVAQKLLLQLQIFVVFLLYLV